MPLENPVKVLLQVEQQLFLQQILENDYMPINQAITILNTIKEHVDATDERAEEQPVARKKVKVDEAYLKKSIRTINDLIKWQELQILIGKCEVSSSKYVALISTVHSEITELQTQYTQTELSYWLPLMEEIIKSDRKSLDRISCLNLASKYNIAIGLDATEQFIEKCLKKGYLMETGGRYFLGTKTILEFNNDLRNAYEGYVQICELCSELCCYGSTCTNCNKLMHDYCIKTVLVAKKECPLCHVAWGDFDFEHMQESQHSFSAAECSAVAMDTDEEPEEVGEEDEESDDKDEEDDDEDEESDDKHDEDDDEDEDEEETNTTQRSSQRLKRLR